jgi:hypothetical protein
MSDDRHDDGFEVVARYHVEDEANQAVEALVLRGVGAVVERQPHEAPFTLLVVAGQADRAREVLGLPAVVTEDAPVPKARSQLVWVLLIFAAAMVVLPVIAFFVSFKLSGG